LHVGKIHVNLKLLGGIRYDTVFQDQEVPVSVFMVKIAASEPLKRVTGRILGLISNFKGKKKG
jgi:hypothetical protein